MRKWVLAALALPGMATAQLEPQGRTDADPALWVVKDADTTIYLFGTVHVLDGKRDWFNDEVREAFDASDELRLEAVVPEDELAMAPLVAKYAVDPKGKLSRRLKPETWRQLGEAMDAQGVPAAALETFEPWFLATMLSGAAAERAGLIGEHGAENILTRAAQDAGKPVTELEGVETQLRMLDGMPDAMQVTFLEQTLAEIDKAEQIFPAMIKAWAAGNSDALAAMLNDSIEADPGLYKLMLSDRNGRWADWIAGRMARPGSVFLAVGAAHLAGRDSVQNLLAAKGLKTERVRQRRAVRPPA